ncbi:MAG: serine hydrolase, partial [Bacteroidia bacterium]|nr:serine hydrolase [Bacteroidia bacterium]
MKFVLFIITLSLLSCQKNSPDSSPVTPPATFAPLYFPPLTGTAWETTSASSLGWNEPLMNDLYTYLQQKNTKAFIILKNGKIVAEKYFGTFTSDS